VLRQELIEKQARAGVGIAIHKTNLRIQQLFE